jgi:hypothetical protein
MLVATLPKLKNQSSIVGFNCLVSTHQCHAPKQHKAKKVSKTFFKQVGYTLNATMLTNSNLFQNTSQTTKKGRKLKNKK